MATNLFLVFDLSIEVCLKALYLDLFFFCFISTVLVRMWIVDSYVNLLTINPLSILLLLSINVSDWCNQNAFPTEYYSREVLYYQVMYVPKTHYKKITSKSIQLGILTGSSLYFLFLVGTFQK